MRDERGLLQSAVCSESGWNAAVRLQWCCLHSGCGCMHDDGRLLRGIALRCSGGRNEGHVRTACDDGWLVLRWNNIFFEWQHFEWWLELRRRDDVCAIRSNMHRSGRLLRCCSVHRRTLRVPWPELSLSVES
jgi:hypothetical protein